MEHSFNEKNGMIFSVDAEKNALRKKVPISNKKKLKK
jgi:hypothetical protein